MQQPTLSVITVCYNARDALRRTLVSVLAQTYPHIEYIVIDGASTDGTAALIKEWAGCIDQVVSEPDDGIYDAMNKGLKRASGTYLCFLNAGDTFPSSLTVAKALDGIDTDLPGVIYGQTNIVDADGIFLHPRHHTAPAQLTYDSFRRGMLVCHQSFYVRRDLAPLYDTRYRYSADYDWCLRVLRTSPANHYTGTVLTNYLSEGVTTQNRWPSLRERFRIMVRHYGFFGAVGAHIGILFRRLFKKRTAERL